VKESEKKKKESENSEKERESESRHGVQETPTLRKGERQRKNYGEIESEQK